MISRAVKSNRRNQEAGPLRDATQKLHRLVLAAKTCQCLTPGASHSGAGMGNRCCRCFGDDKNDLEETLIASANTSDVVLPSAPHALCRVRAGINGDACFSLLGCSSQPRGCLSRPHAVYMRTAAAPLFHRRAWSSQDARGSSAHVRGNRVLTCIPVQGMDAPHSPTATSGAARLPRKGASGLRAFLVVRHCDHGFLLLEVSA